MATRTKSLQEPATSTASSNVMLDAAQADRRLAGPNASTVQLMALARVLARLMARDVMKAAVRQRRLEPIPPLNQTQD